MSENTRSMRSEEHTSELQSRENLVCRLQLEKKNDFGDMGRRLEQAIQRRIDTGALPWPLLPAGECIRATELGASEYSVQLFFFTRYVSHPGLLSFPTRRSSD